MCSSRRELRHIRRFFHCILKSNMIQTVLQRRFDLWTAPGSCLTDTDYTRDPVKEETTRVNLKSHYQSPVPESDSSNTPESLPADLSADSQSHGRQAGYSCGGE